MVGHLLPLVPPSLMSPASTMLSRRNEACCRAPTPIPTAIPSPPCPLPSMAARPCLRCCPVCLWWQSWIRRCRLDRSHTKPSLVPGAHHRHLYRPAGSPSSPCSSGAHVAYVPHHLDLHHPWAASHPIASSRFVDPMPRTLGSLAPLPDLGEKNSGPTVPIN